MDHKDAYICYNKADRDWVSKLAEQLESETIDGSTDGRKLTVFFDQWDMGPGDSLIDRMNEGMDVAKHVVVVLSPEFLNADWPRFEWKNIVAQDPNNSKGKLIPLLLRDVSQDGNTRIDFCAPFRDLKYLDFRKPSDFKKQFLELIRKLRSLPPQRGQIRSPLAGFTPQVSSPVIQSTAMADEIEEKIFSNLLLVEESPEYIWSAPTIHEEKSQVWSVASRASPFILRSKRIYTFANLENKTETLRQAVDTTQITKVRASDWVQSVDQSKWLTSLLNSCLSAFLREKWIKPDGKGRFYFLPSENNQDRTYPSATGRPRTVAKCIVSQDTGSEFWVHQAAQLNFRRIGERMFLCVVPLYLFTEDGRTSITGKAAGKLSQMWMGKQQNDAIFRDFTFWVYVLGRGKRNASIPTGGPPISISTLAAAAKLDRGIAFDTIEFRALFQSEPDDISKILEEADSIEEFIEEEEYPF